MMSRLQGAAVSLLFSFLQQELPYDGDKDPLTARCLAALGTLLLS